MKKSSKKFKISNKISTKRKNVQKKSQIKFGKILKTSKTQRNTVNIRKHKKYWKIIEYSEKTWKYRYNFEKHGKIKKIQKTAELGTNQHLRYNSSTGK